MSKCVMVHKAVLKCSGVRDEILFRPNDEIFS
jgi:hypothetical protein